MSIEVTHEWSANQWDWPAQHKDGVVKVYNTPDKWEVGLDCAYFTPKEIEVKVADGHLHILCKHDTRSDLHGSIGREISRSYRLPDDIEPDTIRTHLTHHGVLQVTAQKKK